MIRTVASANRRDWKARKRESRGRRCVASGVWDRSTDRASRVTGDWRHDDSNGRVSTTHRDLGGAHVRRGPGARLPRGLVSSCAFLAPHRAAASIIRRRSIYSIDRSIDRSTHQERPSSSPPSRALGASVVTTRSPPSSSSSPARCVCRRATAPRHIAPHTRRTRRCESFAALYEVSRHDESRMRISPLNH